MSNITKKQAQELAVADLENMAGLGTDEIGMEDMSQPWLKLLQPLSPECTKGQPEYVEGAEPGKFVYTATNKVVDELELYPLKFRHSYIEWVPRSAGGGFIADHDIVPDDVKPHPERRGVMVKPSGSEVIETITYIFAMRQTDGSLAPAYASFTSTQLKAVRKLNTTLKMLKIQGKNGLFTPPIFASRVTATSESARNDQGTWYKWVLTRDSMADAELLPKLKELWKLAQESIREVDMSQSGSAPTVDDEDMPF